MISDNVGIEDLELPASDLDLDQAAAIYQEHGALVVRGLMEPYVEQVRRDIMARFEIAHSLYDQARKVDEGWVTPDGTLWLPAPEGFERERQVMVLGCGYTSSAAFFQSALHAPTLDLVEKVLGPNLELYLNGQCLVKEPVGGHPKMLHQDGAYFTHKYEGPMGMLNYAVDTPVERGALHVVPGSHKLGILDHEDTFSHLGLSLDDWPWERALPIEGKAGDAIFFHVKTIHGSKPNHTKEHRPVFIHRYRAANDYVTIQSTTAEKRAKRAELQEEAKKENQLGFMVRGFRTYEAAPEV